MEKSNEEKKECQLTSMPRISRGSADEPWLVFFHGKRKEFQTFYRISEDGQYHVKKIPRLRHKSISTCSHGWMVLTDSITDECFLLNPTTMEEIQLPSVNIDFWRCVLSGPPSDPNFTVMLISSPKEGLFRFWFCCPKRPGGTTTSPVVNHWMKQDVDSKTNLWIGDAVGYEGKIYALTIYTDTQMSTVTQRTDTIMIAEVVGVTNLKVRLIEAKGRELCFKGFTATQQKSLVLDPCGRQIYVVNKIYLGDDFPPWEFLDIQVLKLDISKENAWEKVNDLGNRSIFLGPYSSTCFIAYVDDSGSGIKRNTVYFTMEQDTHLYAYDLEEKSITNYLPCPNVKHDCSEPIWMQMRPPGSF